MNTFDPLTKNMKPCKHCRRAMRLWALDARRFPKHKSLCVRTAIIFRDTCSCEN